MRHRPKGLILTLSINWLIKPFTMAGLAYLFFRFIYADFVPAAEADEYIAGMILLGVAPCTAMVFVWSQLTNGNPNYTLAQVSINDLILVFAFAPIAGLLLGVTDLIVPWATLIASVAIFVVVHSAWASQPGPHSFVEMGRARSKPLRIDSKQRRSSDFC